jgi:molecular chaperone Hsp33
VTAPAPTDRLVRTLSADGGVAARALVATGLVAEAQRRHATSPTATSALGRALMGAVLLASDAKDDETVQLQFRGDGPLGAITVISDAAGRVRGFASHPEADPPIRAGKLDVGRAVGRGILAVVRYHPSWKEPYSGIVPLASGEIAEDIAHYLRDSEQKPSAVALGVHVDASGAVDAAGGYFVQALPDASESTLIQLERNVMSLPPPSELVREGQSAESIADLLLLGLGRRDVQASAPAFFCGCDRARVLRAVALLGRADLREIAAKGEAVEVRCAFCAERYAVDPDEAGALLPDA